jgi:hypothetical protein
MTALDDIGTMVWEQFDKLNFRVFMISRFGARTYQSENGELALNTAPYTLVSESYGSEISNLSEIPQDWDEDEVSPFRCELRQTQTEKACI